MVFADAFLESTKFCAAKGFFRAAGAWIRTRNFHQVKVKRSIAFAKHIRSYRTTLLCRSTWRNGLLKLLALKLIKTPSPKMQAGTAKNFNTKRFPSRREKHRVVVLLTSSKAKINLNGCFGSI